MRRTILGAGLIAVSFIALAAPALAQSKVAIQKLEDQWGAAFNKGDAAAVAALYTEDAYVLRPARRWSKARLTSRISGAPRCSS